MDAQGRRQFIRNKVACGALPSYPVARLKGRRGRGESCSGCDRTVLGSEPLIEATQDDGRPAVRFHVECFYIWAKMRHT